jgi:RNA polymerase sigma-70 factor (ECF subfamily)
VDDPGKTAQDEGELIRAATDGNRSAFNDLVRLKRERVVRIAYQVTGDWDDALDVAQGVFLRLWRSLDRYDPARRFDTWLYRVTANAAIDLLRSRGPKGHLQPLPEEHGELSDESVVDAESAVGTAELQQAFQRLAAGLAPKQRMVFVLKEIEGLETVEVARIMDVAESTVRNHLLQARRVLRAGLERDYPGLVPTRIRRRRGGEEG